MAITKMRILAVCCKRPASCENIPLTADRIYRGVLGFDRVSLTVGMGCFTFREPLPISRPIRIAAVVRDWLFQSIFDAVFDDALSSDDFCIPIGEAGLCSKDTDLEVIDDRTVPLLERASQHVLELLGRLLKFVQS